MIIKHTKQITTALFLALVVWSCGDNGTGTKPEDPPTTPSLEAAEPDLSFFQDNNPQKMAGDKQLEVNHYTSAQLTVLSGSAYFMIGQVYGSFFSEMDYEQADFNDGVWEWSYSSSYQNVSTEFKVTAQELSSSTKWAMSWSFNDGETGYEDYTIMEGTIADDESHGDWTFNSLNAESSEEVPFLRSTWQATSDTERDLTLERLNATGEVTTTVKYVEDQPVYSMTFSHEDEPNDTIITWNTDTNIGSIIQDGTEQCWDEDFQDVSCD